jgi:hypothetical protein
MTVARNCAAVDRGAASIPSKMDYARPRLQSAILNRDQEKIKNPNYFITYLRWKISVSIEREVNTCLFECC